MIESRDWTAYNAAQSEEKSRFVALLADLCSTVAQPKQEGKGRPRLPLSDMLFASVYKVYVGFSSRRFTSDLRDAFVDGHVKSTPHFNSVSRYLSDAALTNMLKDLITHLSPSQDLPCSHPLTEVRVVSCAESVQDFFLLL